MPEPILVIDFGTTSCCAALIVDGRVEFLHEPSTGALVWPSSVVVDGDEVLVGSRAEGRKTVRASQYRSEVKRYLTRNETLQIGGVDYQPEQLAAHVLAALRAEAEHVHGAPVTHALLTKPAVYGRGDARNDRLLAAAAEAGFTVTELLAEPVAAAFSAPSGDAFESGRLVLVYDLGGGTFDAALVRIAGGADGKGGADPEHGEHELVASGGLPSCGGFDIDIDVFDLLCARYPELLAFSESGDRGRVSVLDAAEKVKKELSQSDQALQEVMGIEIAVGRREFEPAATAVVRQTIECCRKLLDEVGVTPDDLDAVFLAGGGSRMPLVAKLLTAEFGTEPRTAREPELAVIRGAVNWALRVVPKTASPITAPLTEQPLRWAIPGGYGTLVAREIDEGQTFADGAVLAVVRLPDGGLTRLAAAEGNRVAAWHAAPGDVVRSGQWLLTTDRVHPAWTFRQNLGSDVKDLTIATGEGLLFLAYRNRCVAIDLLTGRRAWKTSFTSDTAEWVAPQKITVEATSLTIAYLDYFGQPATVTLHIRTGKRS